MIAKTLHTTSTTYKTQQPTKMIHRHPTPQWLCPLSPWQHPPWPQHLAQCLPRVHARLAPAVLAVPRLVTSFGIPTHTSSRNRAMGMALALSGQNLKGRHNNQPSVGISGGKDFGEVACRGWSAWGNTVPSFGTSNGATQK